MAIVAALVSGLALLTSRRAFRVAERSFARSALYDAILKSFIDRPFVDGTGDLKVLYPVGLEGPVTTLRMAKQVARSFMRRDVVRWNERSVLEELGLWQNRIAYETADTLTQFGLAVFTGMIPLNEAMANVADVVIDDWMICASWIESYRASEKASKDVDGDVVPYHRRHAEWVFLVARLWMEDNGWRYPLVPPEHRHVPTLDQTIQRLELFQKAETLIMQNEVRRAVDRQLARAKGRHWQ